MEAEEMEVSSSLFTNSTTTVPMEGTPDDTEAKEIEVSAQGVPCILTFSMMRMLRRRKKCLYKE